MSQNTISLFMAERLIQHLFGSVPYVKPSQYRMSLWVGNPGRDGTAGGFEVTAPEYQRLNVTLNPVTNQQKARNANNLIWANPTSNWGAVSHWAIHDNASEEDMLYSGPWDTPVSVTNGGTPFTVPIGGFELNFGNPP